MKGKVDTKPIEQKNLIVSNPKIIITNSHVSLKASIAKNTLNILCTTHAPIEDKVQFLAI